MDNCTLFEAYLLWRIYGFGFVAVCVVVAVVWYFASGKWAKL